MFKLALVAAATNAHTKKDLATLHGSLDAMLDGLAATYHTDSAYKMSAKNKAIVDAPYYKEIDGSVSLNSVSYYNKFTDYTAYCADDMGNTYDYVYSYSGAYRNYYSMYCPTDGSDYYLSIDYVYGDGYQVHYNRDYGYYGDSFNVHVWNLEHNLTKETVRDAFNHTLEASNDFADELAQISGDIKEANIEIQRKGDKAFETYEETLETIEEIQARATQ